MGRKHDLPTTAAAMAALANVRRRLVVRTIIASQLAGLSEDEMVTAVEAIEMRWEKAFPDAFSGLASIIETQARRGGGR